MKTNKMLLFSSLAVVVAGIYYLLLPDAAEAKTDDSAKAEDHPVNKPGIREVMHKVKVNVAS